MSEGSMDLLLTDGNHNILLHPEEWPLDAEFWDAKYYVTLEKTEVRDNGFFITIKMLAKQWQQWTLPCNIFTSKIRQSTMGIGQRSS